VRENLLLQIPPWDRRRSPDEALEIFPALKGRLNAQAGSLSGGQQQILALCRCYLASPRVILLDEVSTGLAPQIVDQIFESLHNLARDGIAMLLVEQYVTRALEIADQVILLNRGCVVFTKKPSDIDRAALVSDYLGSSEVIKADSGTPSMLHT
jgi:branched-chain amino acid transport system ATP-binding protein